MAYLYCLFATCVHYSVLCHWMFVGATGSLTSASNLVQSSVVTHSFERKTSIPAPSMTVTSTKMAITSLSSSFVPSPSKTSKPGNLTVTASFNGTVTPQNMTITPSHMTTAVLNSSVMPPSTGSIRPSPVSTVLPSSTVHPTPTSLPPAPGNFTVKYNGTVCLFAYMAAKFDVTTSSKKLTFELPKNAKSSGECDTRSKDHPFIKLSWSTHSHDCSFTMHFEKFSKDTTTNTVTQYWMAANLTFSVKFNNSTTVFHSVKETFHALSAGIGDAYACPSAPAINLTAKKSIAEVTLTRFKFQPFGVKSGHFGNVTNCVLPTTPTASPSTSPPKTKQPNRQHESHRLAIAVGCSLAGLALVAVIGYLIWRHRSRNNQGGYRKL